MPTIIVTENTPVLLLAYSVYVFSRVQELEATLYPLVSVRVYVCGCVCMCVCVSLCQHRVIFAYKSQTDDWIFMIFTYNIDINETKKLTRGQGHKVKGQGQICSYTKTLFWL